MFDVNFVLSNYGLKGVLFEITFIEIINAFLLRDAIADPCPLVRENKKLILFTFLLVVWIYKKYSQC